MPLASLPAACLSAGFIGAIGHRGRCAASCTLYLPSAPSAPSAPADDNRPSGCPFINRAARLINPNFTPRKWDLGSFEGTTTARTRSLARSIYFQQVGFIEKQIGDFIRQAQQALSPPLVMVGPSPRDLWRAATVDKYKTMSRVAAICGWGLGSAEARPESRAVGGLKVLKGPYKRLIQRSKRQH